MDILHCTIDQTTLPLEKQRKNMVATFKWSIADWHELVDSGVLAERRVELLEGEIIQMSPEGPMHIR